ncbi:hypothetical protein C0991_004433 [Blastosporella zonata]|nr:hypothetical protein C0991_004433 [Blastosporella zonata]
MPGDSDPEKDGTIVGHEKPDEKQFPIDNAIESPETIATGQEYPEGGLKAWSVLLGVWIVQFCTFGYTNAYGVYNE